MNVPTTVIIMMPYQQASLGNIDVRLYDIDLACLYQVCASSLTPHVERSIGWEGKGFCSFRR